MGRYDGNRVSSSDAKTEKEPGKRRFNTNKRATDGLRTTSKKKEKKKKREREREEKGRRKKKKR